MVRFFNSTVIFHNVPEDDLSFGADRLKSDSEKINFIICSAQVKVEPTDVESLQRLGKRNDNKHRPLKITLSDTDAKFAFLNARKSISMNDTLRQVFHNRVYVNTDNSFLRQKEEFRLRQRLKDLKNEKANSRSFIPCGALYLNGSIVGKVDVRNHLF